MNTPDHNTERKHPTLDFLRRAASFVLVDGLTAVVIASYVPATGISSCRDALAGSATVRVCQPFGTSDALVVGLVLLVAVLLLWPDLSEFNIAGLITLKRQIDEARRVAEEGKRTSERLMGDARYIYMSQPIPDLGASVSDARAKAGAFTADAAIVAAQAPYVSEERTGLEARLLGLADDLDVYVQMLSGQTIDLRKAREKGALPAGDLDLQMTELRRWQSQFDAQLRTWGIVRNTVVHVPERLSDDEVRTAIELGDLLLRTARTCVEAGANGSDDVIDR